MTGIFVLLTGVFKVPNALLLESATHQYSQITFKLNEAQKAQLSTISDFCVNQ